jgi:cytochrome c553
MKMTTRWIFTFLFVLMLAAGSVQAGGDAARGEGLAADTDCAMCHGDNGMGDEDNPNIAGMDEAAFVAALQGYKSGEREDESGMMADYAVDLSDQDMADLAAYYKSLGTD